MRIVTSKSLDVLLRCYSTYIVPIIEFASSVWSPFLLLESKKLETVQHLFTRLVYYRCFPDRGYPRSMPSYESRCKTLKLHSLAYRRVVSDLVMGFKILRSLCIVKFSNFFRIRVCSGRRGSFSFYVDQTKKNFRNYCFALRTARWFNMLSANDSSIFYCHLLELLSMYEIF